MASFLYAVQDDQGREIVSAHVDVEKVSDVTVDHDIDTDEVLLTFEGIPIERGMYHGEGSLTLCRWPSDDKLAKPVKHPVR